MKNTIIILFLSLILASCTGVQVDPNDPNAYLIKGIDHVQQGNMQCGAASLKMVLNYYGKEANLNEIYSKIRTKRGGARSSSVQGYPIEFYNMRTISFVPNNYKTLKKFIDKDIPLIARGKSNSPYADCHYVVIAGYKKDGFIIDDPMHGLQFMTFNRFKAWHNCIHDPRWVLAIYPKDFSEDIPSIYFD